MVERAPGQFADMSTDFRTVAADLRMSSGMRVMGPNRSFLNIVDGVMQVTANSERWVPFTGPTSIIVKSPTIFGQASDIVNSVFRGEKRIGTGRYGYNTYINSK